MTTAERYKDNPLGLKKYRLWDRKYQRNKRKNTDLKKEENRLYRFKNAEKIKAHRKLHQALRLGIVIKEPCVECGDRKSQAHHYSYKKPLDVVWLCASHHKLRHTSIKGRKIKTRNAINSLL